MVQNYLFMSGRLSGTRQARRGILHVVFSSCVAYGTPVFLTITPSERHGGQVWRLSRYRRNDPAMQHVVGDDFKKWIGYDQPSLFTDEAAEIDLPDYDTRREMSAKDPLACVYGFRVMAEVVMPSLMGMRMCPQCPDCVLSKKPCMDRFGSNATAIGGSAGRGDALVGAVEAQKAEGVLHVHAFIFIQMVHQFCTLEEIAAKLRAGLLTATAMKAYVNFVRCAAYPDIKKFNEERAAIEKAWPTYPEDPSLSFVPRFLGHTTGTSHIVESTDTEAWYQEGLAWRMLYDQRHQHVMSRMNHHIHPLVNEHTGERRVLGSCVSKNKPGVCKSGFPLFDAFAMKDTPYPFPP